MKKLTKQFEEIVLKVTEANHYMIDDAIDDLIQAVKARDEEVLGEIGEAPDGEVSMDFGDDYRIQGYNTAKFEVRTKMEESL